MAAPALYRDTSDGQIKRFATAREVELEIQDIQALADATAVNLFTTATAAVNIATSVAVDNNITIGPSGNQIIIDNTTGTPLITLDGNVSITGTEAVSGNTTFTEDVELGSASDDLIVVKGTLTCEANCTFGESTTGGDVITFLGKSDNKADIVFTDATVSTDITFDGTNQGLVNDSANLTLSTTTSGNVELSGADDVNVTIGTTAGDVFSVNTDLLYIDGNTGRTMINTATPLPAGNTAQLTVNHDTADKPVITLKSGAVTATSILTGSTNPSAPTGVPAGTGSLYMLNTGTLYVKTAAGDTAWAAIGTTAGSTLQAAYNQTNGNTIAMSTSKPLTFSTNETGASESNFIVQTSAAAAYLVADAVGDKLVLGSSGIGIDAANDIQMTGTTPTINATALDLSLTTTTSGNIIINPAAGGEVGINTASPSANTAATVSAAADRVLALENVADSAVVEIQTGTDPSGITGPTGSIYLEYDGTTGTNAKVWLNQSDAGSGTVWTELASDANVDQQDAYDNGPGVTMTAALGDMVLTLDETSTFADFIVTGGTGNHLRADANTDTLILGSAGISISAANDIEMTGTTPTINATSLNLDLTTTTAGDVNISAAAEVDIDGGTSVAINSVTTMALASGGAFSIDTAAAGDTITITADSVGAVDAISLLTTTSGNIAINSVGNVDIDGATGVEINASAASNFTVASANLTLSTTTTGDVVLASAAAVDIDSVTFDVLSSGAFSIDGTGASNVSATSGNLTLSALTSGDVLVTSAGDIDLAAAAGEVTVSSGTAEVMSLLTGTVDPSASATAANAGSLFMRDDTSTGELYIKQDDGSSTNWSKVATVDDAGDVVMTALPLEDVDEGELLYMFTDGTVGLADANAAGKIRPLGIALETVTLLSGLPVRIALAGEVKIKSVIAAASEGKYLYMDATVPGGIVVAPPGTAGDTVQRVGICTVDGATLVAKCSISFGEPTLI